LRELHSSSYVLTTHTFVCSDLDLLYLDRIFSPSSGFSCAIHQVLAFVAFPFYPLPFPFLSFPPKALHLLPPRRCAHGSLNTLFRRKKQKRIAVTAAVCFASSIVADVAKRGITRAPQREAMLFHYSTAVL
jgi:hypothetical protein